MHVLTKEAHYALRALAMLVGASLLLWTLGVTPFSQRADAANVTQFSDTLSDSDLGVSSNHTIGFTLPNGAQTGQQIVLTLTSFTVPVGFDHNDVDVTVNGGPIDLGSTAAANTWGVATTSTTITFTTSTSSGIVTAASSSAIVIRLGTNASFAATGNTQVTNPAVADSYELQVGGTIADSGRTRVVILDDVLVTANVSTTFEFNVYGLATSTEVNGTSTTRTSTATAIPFGTLSAGSIVTLAQDLTVETNAAYGFVVTVFQSDNLKSSTLADIDGFADGAYTNTPASWTAPTGSIANENTWGHWGLTSEDDLNGDEFSTNLWVAASTTPRQIFQHSSSSNGITPNIGSTTIGFQAQITSLQEAGDDYNTTLTYIATPTF